MTTVEKTFPTTKNTAKTAAKKKISYGKGKIIADIINYTLLITASILVVFPILVVLFNSFKTPTEYMYSGSFDLPQSFLNFDNYLNAFFTGNILNGFKNSITLIIGSLILNVALGTMLAYALGRFDFKFKKLILGLFTMAVIIPTVTTQVATFSIIKALGFYNTYFAGFLIYCGTDIIQIYIYLQFVEKIPFELDEAAMIEGASYLRIYSQIIFPLLLPATVTVIIIKTINIYNDLFTTYLYMPSKQTVSLALYTFAGDRGAQWNVMSAAIIIALIPTLAAYLFMQKYILSGLTNGAVKG